MKYKNFDISHTSFLLHIFHCSVLSHFTSLIKYEDYYLFICINIILLKLYLTGFFLPYWTAYMYIHIYIYAFFLYSFSLESVAFVEFDIHFKRLMAPQLILPFSGSSTGIKSLVVEALEMRLLKSNHFIQLWLAGKRNEAVSWNEMFKEEKLYGIQSTS